MDPRRLLVLRVVARTGSIAQAAHSLHLTAPAVSQQLAALERELGVAVIDRSGRRAALTVAGRLLAQTAERIHDELADGQRRLAELTGSLAGPLRVAAFQSVMGPLVAPALCRVALEHPEIETSVIESYGSTALDGLQRGELDVVLYEHDAGENPPSGPGLATTKLLFDPYRLVMPATWPIQVTRVDELIGRPWVAGPQDISCHRMLRRLLSDNGAESTLVDACVEVPSMLALVAAGRGAAIVPRLAVQGADVTVVDLDLGGRIIGAIYPSYRGHARPAAASLVGALISVSSSLQ